MKRKWTCGDIAMVIGNSEMKEERHGFKLGDLVVVNESDGMMSFPIYAENKSHSDYLSHEELFYIGRL